MEQVNNSVVFNTLDEMSQELNRVAQVMSDTSENTSRTAYLVSAQAIGGAVSIVRTPTTSNTNAWITCYIGGLGIGASVNVGKLTIADRINREDYSGSCSVVIFSVIVGYTNIVGYDENSNPVLWFNGGGVGMNFFTGGGRFVVTKKVS